MTLTKQADEIKTTPPRVFANLNARRPTISPLRSFARPAVLLLVLVALSYFATGPASAQEPVHGPFRVVEQNPAYRLFHTPQSEGADLLEAGAFRIGGGLAYGNILEIRRGALSEHPLDMERLSTDLELRWAPADGWEVGGGIRTFTDWGGFLDGFLLDFHDFFGFPNDNRGAVEDDQYKFEIVQEPGDVRLSVPRESLALDDVRFFVKRRLHRADDGSLVVSARSVLSLAAGPSSVETGRVDVAAEVLARQSFGRWHLHGTVGVTTLDAPRELTPITRSQAFYMMVGGERLLADWISLVAQFVGGTGYFDGVGSEQVDGTPMNLVVGVAGGGEGPWEWELSLAEDVVPNNPSTDFTLGLRVARTF